MVETFLSVIAVVVATFCAAFSWWTWRQSNRPVVAAMVKTAKAGNQLIAYSLVVSNVGSRPAVGVRLDCDQDGLRQALTDPEGAPYLEQATRCFSADAVYPLIADGESVKHAFGVTAREAENSTWRYGARFRVTLTYSDLGGRRKYRSSLDVAIIDSDSFAGSSWGEPSS